MANIFVDQKSTFALAFAVHCLNCSVKEKLVAVKERMKDTDSSRPMGSSRFLSWQGQYIAGKSSQNLDHFSSEFPSEIKRVCSRTLRNSEDYNRVDPECGV